MNNNDLKPLPPLYRTREVIVIAVGVAMWMGAFGIALMCWNFVRAIKGF